MAAFRRSKKIDVVLADPKAEKMAQLYTQLAGETQKKNNLYRQIGEKYITIHGVDHEIGFSELVDSVSAADQKIKDYHRKIMWLKGIQVCEKCGKESPQYARFCCYCAAPLPEAPVIDTDNDNILTCPWCGQAVQPGQEFCTNCGKCIKRIKVDDTASTSVSPVTPIVPIAPVNGTTRVCPVCGTLVEAGSGFCTECGTRMDDAAPTSPPIMVDEVQLGKQTCPKCGAVVEAGNAFCVECGTKL